MRELSRSEVVCISKLLLVAKFRLWSGPYPQGGVRCGDAQATGVAFLNNGVGGVSAVIVTDGTLGPLSAVNILDFQMGVTILASPPANTVSSDIS